MPDKNRGFKGELTFKILELLMRGVLTTRAIILANVKSARSVVVLNRRWREEMNRSENDLCDFLEKQRFYKLISKLKREGMVTSKKGFWGITKEGENKYKSLLNRFLLKKSYQKEKDKFIKVIAFDIPEKEKNKRMWLVSVLKELNFFMLQKSVWIGKIKIPKELIEDIEREGLLQKVHIFSVAQSGTLDQFSINLD